MDWHSLKSIRCWTPLADLAFKYTEVGEDLYRVWPCGYIYAVDTVLRKTEYITIGGPFATIALWAETDGAAKRALNRNIEGDSLGDIEPPVEMLVSKDCVTYGQLAYYAKSRAQYHPCAETANYRIATDGAFLHRTVAIDNFIYMFRSEVENNSEVPFAIQYQLNEV